MLSVKLTKEIVAHFPLCDELIMYLELFGIGVKVEFAS